MSENGNLSENGRSDESKKSTESGQRGAGHAERFHAKQPRSGNRSPGKWLFLCSFIFSCLLFWWLRSILLQLVLGLQDSVDDSTIQISVVALICFTAGYLFPKIGSGTRHLPATILDACGDFAYRVTTVLFVPALLLAIGLVESRGAADYGANGPMPRALQALLYTHLFFGFMCIGAADPAKQGWKRIWIAAAMLTLPRLIISLHGGRFFLAQALVPVLLIAMARGWVRLTLRHMVQLSVIALFIIYVPAITRGDLVLGAGQNQQMFLETDVLGLYQNNTDLSLDPGCPPLLISLTAKTIPYSLLGVCVIDFGGLKNMPATLERILTNNDPGSSQGTVDGTGSNYLLELYVTGGLFAVYFGSVLFGFTCRNFLAWCGKRSLFAGIWAECLTRALLAPRGNLGYVYERIPSLVLTTWLLVLVVWGMKLLQREYSAGSLAKADFKPPRMPFSPNLSR
jgi:O-antigen polysaccharide polymerase Wzy